MKSHDKRSGFGDIVSRRYVYEVRSEIPIRGSEINIRAGTASRNACRQWLATTRTCIYIVGLRGGVGRRGNVTICGGQISIDFETSIDSTSKIAGTAGPRCAWCISDRDTGVRGSTEVIVAGIDASGEVCSVEILIRGIVRIITTVDGVLNTIIIGEKGIVVRRTLRRERLSRNER